MTPTDCGRSCGCPIGQCAYDEALKKEERQAMSDAATAAFGDCTHIIPERGVGCKLCEEFFAHQDRLEADPVAMERQERLWMQIENKTLRTALEQIRQIIKDVIGEELEL